MAAEAVAVMGLGMVVGPILDKKAVVDVVGVGQVEEDHKKKMEDRIVGQVVRTVGQVVHRMKEEQTQEAVDQKKTKGEEQRILVVVDVEREEEHRIVNLTKEQSKTADSVEMWAERAMK